ncbi:MAG: hypothetical protein HQL26_02795 [Candidatus Omnitrophica bacterium]|nr:hypothetical protein [Candidatus Omnitrophota bacterium]
MTITKLKAKNQLTIPTSVIKRMGLKPHELFTIDVEKGYIKLTPVTVEPRYAPDELQAIDVLVEEQKSKGKKFKAGKEFADYLKHIVKE